MQDEAKVAACLVFSKNGLLNQGPSPRCSSAPRPGAGRIQKSGWDGMGLDALSSYTYSRLSKCMQSDSPTHKPTSVTCFFPPTDTCSVRTHVFFSLYFLWG